MRTITRYASNRKMFCRQAKRYITHVDLARMIQNNEEFIILDHPARTDVTAQVLGQLVATKSLNNQVTKQELFKFIKEVQNEYQN